MKSLTWTARIVLIALTVTTVAGGLAVSARSSANDSEAHQAHPTRAGASVHAGRCAPAWRALTAPNPGLSNTLFAVSALSGKNVWAVGSQTKDGATFDTLVDHFDGVRWRSVRSPNPPSDQSVLFGVAAVAAHDVWAVGRIGTPFAERVRALIEHYDGTSWKIAKAPKLAGDAYLSAVLGFGPNNVWAAGFTRAPGSAVRALMLHWNGSRWSLAPLPPDPGVNNYLFALGASGRRDVWAVGANFHGNGDPTTIHWDGHAWRRIRVTTSTPSDAFNSVAAPSPGEAWAGGTGGIYQNNKAIMAHWNGAKWSFVRFPQLATGLGPEGQGPVNQVDALAGSSPDDVWAAGESRGWSSSAHRGPLTGFTAHWDGKSWRAWPRQINRSSHQIAVLNNGSSWSVGEQDGPRGFHSAIDHICPVRVSDQHFMPKHTSVALGETAAWKIVKAHAPVSIEDTTGLIRSEHNAAGGSFTYRFKASGTYRIRASQGRHTDNSRTTTHATVAVRPEIRSTAPGRATLRWGLSVVAPGIVFDVQIRRPGTTRFVDWKIGTKLTAAQFAPHSGSGAYAFRARARRVNNASATGFSPPVSIHMS